MNADGGMHPSEACARQGTYDAALLAEAFGSFMRSSSRLEAVYHELRLQIERLTLELNERNRELKDSLARNEAMRAVLQQIMDALPCGVLVLRGDGTVSMMNPECGRMLGAEPNKVADGDRLDMEQLMMNAQGAHRLTAGLLDDVEQEFRVEAEGSERYIRVRGRGISSVEAAESTANRVLVLEDVTARKRAEGDRERGRRAMALAEIAMVLAHEIRNPLASMVLFSDLLESDEEGRGEWMCGLRAAIRLLSSTVDNVLWLHRPRVAPPELIDVAKAVEEAVGLMLPVARQEHVSLSWRAESEHCVVAGYEAGIQQVVVNLLLNAIRHTPAGGTVCVQVDRVEMLNGRPHVRVVCADSGAGISEVDMERLFEAGFSGSGTGAGLGLAVCRQIVAQHAGSIRGENAADSGARFVIEIPAADEEVMHAAA